MKYIETLEGQIGEMQRHVVDLAAEKASVSPADVGWHLSHSAKVIEKVNIQLRNSRANEYAPKMNFMRFFVFLTNSIPRGKGKSPSAVLPEDNRTPENLKIQLSELDKVSPELKNLPENAFFDHPYFNHLNKRQSIKFLTIHTEHHLKIIRDILK